MIFFTKQIYFLGGGWMDVVARGMGWVWGGGGVDGWTDIQAQTSCPLLDGGGGRGAGVSDFFTMNSNLKNNFFFFLGGE